MLLMLIGMSCKATKTVAWTPAGSWDFTVKNTPNGDVSGVLTLTRVDDGYTATMTTPDGQIDLKKVKVEGETLKAVLDYSGYQLDVEGVFAGESMTGSVGMGYDSFPMTATRK